MQAAALAGTSGGTPASPQPLLPPEAVLPPRAGADEDQRQRLRLQHAELERRLGQDPLTFDNEALEVQLRQMQDDYSAMKDDYAHMNEYFSQRLAETSAHLDAQTRLAGTSEGHADCLRDLLHFHEEQGRLIGSYWRTQCEKRDDSIRFLTLKLQEYTTPSAEYQAARQKLPQQPRAAAAADAGDEAQASGQDSGGLAGEGGGSSPSAPTASSPSEAKEPAVPFAASYQALLDEHAELCQVCTKQEEHIGIVDRRYEASQLRCAALRAALEQRSQAAAARGQVRQGSGSFFGGLVGLGTGRTASKSSSASASPASPAAVAASPPAAGAGAGSGEAEDEDEEPSARLARLRTEVAACEEALAASARRRRLLPVWAQRCPWRDELDVRAGQLERISLQFDATKRSLDAANEELQWQATSAEALRIRLADVSRAVQAEDVRTGELHSSFWQTLAAVEALVEQWSIKPPAAAGGEVPPALTPGVQRALDKAQTLVDSIRRREAADGTPAGDGAGTT